MSPAERVFRARRDAGLTQQQLAQRLSKSQSFVSQTESGKAHIGERYIQAVLAACNLDPNWGAPPIDSTSPADTPLRDLAGMDPETCEVVLVGSPRDAELKEKYPWWSNRPW